MIRFSEVVQASDTRPVPSRGALVAVLLAGLVAQTSAARAESYRVDPVHSSVIFKIRHLNTSYFQGRFNSVAGQLTLDAPNPAIDVQVKAESVDTANPARDQHIKSPDFLNARQFPDIAFKSTAIKKVEEGKYDVEGNLTMHGATKPVKLQLVRTGSGRGQRGGTIAGFETSFDIKRSEFGMTNSLESLGDEVRLFIGLECAQQ